MTERKLNNRVRKLIELDAIIKQYNDERDAIIEEIQSEMTGPEEKTNAYLVRWTPFTQTRLDTKAIKADLPDVYKLYARPSESKRFTYKALV